MSSVDRNITEADLVAFADDRLDTARRGEVENWIADHPDDQSKIDLWRAQTAMLRAALDPISKEPVPAHLTNAVVTSRSHYRSRWLGPALAASLALVVGLGGGWYIGQLGWPSAGTSQNTGEAVALAAYKAHQLYTREVRHPVEVRADEEDHLVSWLSKRLDSPLRAPDLTADGLTLLGGRLIPVEGEPGAQLMYENANGDRYTLFAMRADGAQPTALHFEDWGSIGCFYWIEGDIGYALNGPNDHDQLMTIATKVHEVLS